MWARAKNHVTRNERLQLRIRAIQSSTPSDCPPERASHFREPLTRHDALHGPTCPRAGTDLRTAAGARAVLVPFRAPAGGVGENSRDASRFSFEHLLNGHQSVKLFVFVVSHRLSMGSMTHTVTFCQDPI